MWKTIDRMREKPKVVRDRYTFLISFSITAFIALLWLGSLTYTTPETVVAETEDPGGGALSEISALWDGVRDTTASTIDAFRNRSGATSTSEADSQEALELVSIEELLDADIAERITGEPDRVGEPILIEITSATTSTTSAP